MRAVLPVLGLTIVGLPIQVQATGLDIPPHTTTFATPTFVSDNAARFDRLVQLDARVADVAYRLRIANVELCSVKGPVEGWALHSASQYGQALRPIATRRFELDGDTPGILAVAANSPAARAGLSPGDLVRSVNGQALHAIAQPSLGTEPSVGNYGGLALNLEVLANALAQGPAKLVVERDGRRRETTLTPDEGCGYTFQLDTSEEMGGRADGERVYITTALVDFTSDNELAVVLGHEMAHNLLGHRAQFHGRAAGPLGSLTLSPLALARAEREADRTGLFLAVRAGYPARSGGDFWRRFGTVSWRARQWQWGNATASERARRLDAVAVEIRDLQNRGAALRP